MAMREAWQGLQCNRDFPASQHKHSTHAGCEEETSATWQAGGRVVFLPQETCFTTVGDQQNRAFFPSLLTSQLFL